MPFGVALARSSVPSSRSTMSCWARSTSPPNAMPMPSALGSVRAPSENSVPGTVASRMKNVATSSSTAGNR